MERQKALSDIANDALGLREDWRRAARRHKRSVGERLHEVHADELDEYLKLSRYLAASVAVYLPATFLSLKFLTRSGVGLASFSDWDGSGALLAG